jgi:predicted DNA-binding ribbon-helix-helix protein
MRRPRLKLAERNGFADSRAGAHGSSLLSGNVTVSGRRTSIRLEPAMWDALKEISSREAKTVHAVVTEIAHHRNQSSLTAAVRVFLLRYFKAAATEEGHRRAGHRRGDHVPV